MAKNLWWILLLLAYGSGFVLPLACDRESGRGETAVAWKAARELPAHHQLQEGDLEAPDGWAQRLRLLDHKDWIGRHLKARKTTSSPVSSSDLTATPRLEIAAGQRLIVVPLAGQASLAGLLRPQDEVLACYLPAIEKGQATARCLDPAPVVATHRPASSGDPSWVALSVREEQVIDAVQFLTAKERTLVGSPAATDGSEPEEGQVSE